MAIRSGLNLQVGTAEESTYGTPVTVDRFFPVTGESLTNDVARDESEGIIPGQRVIKSEQWYAGKKAVSGDIPMEIETKGFGRWFKHMLGGVATSQPDAANSPTVYKHTFTPGDLPTSLTVQVGVPDTGTGTVRPFTYHGCVIGSWKIEQTDKFAVLTVSLVGEEEENSTALATASYAAGRRQFSWTSTTHTIDGSPVSVSSWSCEGTNSLAEDRYFQGSQLRKRPEEQGLRAYTGSVDGEFESLTAYTRFVNGVEVPMVTTFTGPIIEDAFAFELKVTANIRFDGKRPETNGREIVKQKLPYKVIDNSTTSIKFEYQTSDVTP